MVEALRGLRPVGASCVSLRFVLSVVCCLVLLSRAHLVDPSRDEFPKTHEGVWMDRGAIGVVKRGWGRGPVSQDVLSCLHHLSLVGGNDHGGGRDVVCQVKGDGGLGSDFLNEGDSHVGQGTDGIMAISLVLGLIQEWSQLRLKKRYRRLVIFPHATCWGR